MTSILRRLSTTLTPNSKEPGDSTETSTSSTLRRKSSSAYSSEDNNNSNFRSLGARDYKLAMESTEQDARRSSVSSLEDSGNNSNNFRSLGARDYKLAMDPAEQEARRSSISSMVADMAAADAEGEKEAVMGDEMARRGSKGRIYGSRDWRLIGKDV